MTNLQLPFVFVFSFSNLLIAILIVENGTNQHKLILQVKLEKFDEHMVEMAICEVE
jgi:hypothetical protein